MALNGAQKHTQIIQTTIEILKKINILFKTDSDQGVYLGGRLVIKVTNIELLENNYININHNRHMYNFLTLL